MTDETNASGPRGGSSGGGGPGGGGGSRRRQPPDLVEVVSITHVTPRLVSVLVSGGDLSRFGQAAPTSHIKVFLPVTGQDAPTMPTMTPDGRVWPDDQPRPIVRTYTPRAYDPATGTLEVQFLLHGVGPASEWAQRVSVGDRLAISGPGGRFAPDPGTRRWWIAGDESALPAVGTLLDALPASASAEVHLEADAPPDIVPFESSADVSINWHYRDREGWGTELYKAANELTNVDDTQIWVACEATAVRRIRRLLLDQKRVAVASLVTRGYWRKGEADHPDHDYGED